MESAGFLVQCGRIMIRFCFLCTLEHYHPQKGSATSYSTAKSVSLCARACVFLLCSDMKCLGFVWLNDACKLRMHRKALQERQSIPKAPKPLQLLAGILQIIAKVLQEHYKPLMYGECGASGC